MITLERIANLVAEKVNPLYCPEFVKPVCIVQGDRYEMGRQYGRQLEQPLLTEILYAVSRLLKSRKDGHVMEDAYAFERVLAKKSPGIIEMMHGTADSLELPYEAVLLHMLEADLGGPPLPEGQGGACSTLSAWGEATADGRLLVAVNSDGPFFSTNSFKPVMLLFDPEGRSLFANGGYLSNFVLNDRGLAVMASFGGGLCGKGDRGLGVPAVVSTFLAGLNASTAAEAAAYYLADGRSNSENLHIADGTGDGCIIESTAAHHAVRRPGDFGERDYLIATNFFLSEEMQSSMGEDTPAILNAKSRYRTEDRMIRDRHGSLSLQDLDDIISCDAYFDGEEWHRDVWDEDRSNWTPQKRSPHGNTYLQCLGDPRERSVYIRQGQRCRTVSPIPDAAGEYCRLVLAATPLESVTKAEREAKDQLWRLARTMELQHAASGSLEDALTRIKTWIWEGSGLVQFGNLQSDHGARLANYARAMVRYCKAQVLAKKWNHVIGG